MTALYIIFLGIVPFIAMMALLMYYTRPLVKHWWKKPSTIAANGSRHSTYVARSSPACCMSIWRWTGQLNCSGSCRHVTKPNFVLFCTCCFNTQFCGRREVKPGQQDNSPSQRKVDINRHAQITPDRNPPMLNVGMTSGENITAHIPSVSSSLHIKEEHCQKKHCNIQRWHASASGCWAGRKRERRISPYRFRKSKREIVKAELVFTTNPEVMKFVGQSPVPLESQYSLVNVPIGNIPKVPKDNEGAISISCSSSDVKNDHLNCIMREVPLCDTFDVSNVTTASECGAVSNKVSFSHSAQHHFLNPKSRGQDSIDYSEQAYSEGNNKPTNAFNHFTNSDPVIVNIHPNQQKKFPKVKSYGIASSKLITEVVEVVPKAAKTPASSVKDISSRGSLKRNTKCVSEENMLKTKKLRPKTVITTDIYI